MARFLLTAVLLASGAAAQQPQPPDEEPIYDWTVTVVKARNLRKKGR